MITTAFGACTYVTVAASQTAQRVTTAKGTLLKRIIIQPATVSPGTVVVYDGTGGSPVTVLTFPGGANSVTELKPITVELDIVCTGAGNTTGWHITTGSNVSVVAVVQPH